MKNEAINLRENKKDVGELGEKIVWGDSTCDQLLKVVDMVFLAYFVKNMFMHTLGLYLHFAL